MKITHKKIQASTKTKRPIKASYDVVLRDGEIYRDNKSGSDDLIIINSKPIIAKASSIEEAEKLVRDFIEDYNLTGSQFTGGIVLENDQPVYYISYSGKAQPFDDFVNRWGKGIIYNSRVLKSLGYPGEYDPIFTCGQVNGSSEIKATSFPEKIYIKMYPQTDTGYVYVKDYEHENGGCYYHSDENSNPVDGAFVSLYPDGHLTYLWEGVEKPLNREWTLVDASEDVTCTTNVEATSTRGRIAGLEERIADLQNYIDSALADGTPVEDLVDEQLELQELEDELRFAWADDEAEYNYALEQQEFNPDGSLRGYDDYDY